MSSMTRNQSLLGENHSGNVNVLSVNKDNGNYNNNANRRTTDARQSQTQFNTGMVNSACRNLFLDANESMANQMDRCEGSYEETEDVSILAIILCTILMSSAVASIVLREFLQGFILHGVEHIEYQRKFIGILTNVFRSLFLGICCCSFSWIITYVDSLKPGCHPPTPLSPAKYRRKSGHDFHLSYMICIFNGFLVFLYSLSYAPNSF